MIKFLNKAAAKFNYKLVKNESGLAPDLMADNDFMPLFHFCRPFTMTSPERLFSLFQSVKYIIKNNIPGDFVECGVWKGGSAMMMAKVLLYLGVKDRKIWLYDTYEGMPPPSEADKDFSGEEAAQLLDNADKSDSNSVWCYSSLDEVKTNLMSTGYPKENISFIQGKVEDTIPEHLPKAIALLRLDTDWYESTLHEMKYLYPNLIEKGVLIIDDFGHWEGAKKAILQYFEEIKVNPLIHRIDYTGRIVIK